MRISRDPFSRTELHRTHFRGPQTNCRECGQQPKRGLYSYHVEHDGGRKEHIEGGFCSISCMRAYHGVPHAR